MNEFELIARLTKSLPTNQNVVVGAGDDCAVLDFGVPDKLFLFKTDAVVEGIQFKKDSSPEKIGRKALARCLSDIAAMAGTPVAALVTIGLPENFNPETVVKIYDGMGALAKKYCVAITGGTYTPQEEMELFAWQEGRCHYCGEFLYTFYKPGRTPYHIEHKTPVTRGGSNNIENIALACPKCDGKKYNKTEKEFLEFLAHHPK